jgi:hypothetical protein
MRLHSSIALAALAAAIVVPAAAQAKPRHHAAAAEPVEGNLTTAEQLQLAQQQLAQLQAQLNALQARLDATAAGSPAVAQAQAAAADASAKADKAIALATATQTAQGKTEKKVGAMAWAADTKISGRMYFNISSINAEDAAGANLEKRGGFQIKRFYVGIDHKFNDVFAGNITVDVDNVVGNGSGTICADGTTAKGCNLVGKGLYIKKAYLQAKLSKAFDIRLGSDDLPWIPYVEGVYGYRHLEKTIADLDGFGTSADWGAHVRGELAGGLINYQVSAVNGGTYRNATFTQTVDLEGRINLVYKGFNAAIGGYTGKLANDQRGVTTLHTAQRFDALLAYKGTAGKVGYSIGAEYLYAKNWKRVLSATEDTTEGYSIFASVSPLPKWSVFGRYDWIKPSKDLNPTQHSNYYNVGVQYEPVKIVDLALLYKRTDATAGLGIGDLAAGQRKRDEIGLYGQLRF